MTEEHQDSSGLVSRLVVIESQPLADRAAAYASVHDELARRLDAAPRGADAS